MLGWVALLSFVVTLAVVGLLIGPLAAIALDHPNERSLHQQPVPRTGGVAVVIGVASALGFIGTSAWLPMVLALLLAALSLFDDLRGLPTPIRLAAHFAAAIAFVCFAELGLSMPLAVVLVFALVWITNLYNFMDGSDGLAGGMAVAGFASYAIASLLGGHLPLSALCAAIAAAALAFLTRNFPPARIFMGDVGSIPLGFLAGALGVQGWVLDVWPVWFPLVVFAPFIADASLTLLKRLFRGERIWHAHKEHYYQRMVRMGLGHRGTALVGYALMLLCGASAIAGRNAALSTQAVVVAIPIAAMAGLAIWVDRRWSSFARAS